MTNNTHIPSSDNDAFASVVYTPGPDTPGYGVAALQGGAQSVDVTGVSYAPGVFTMGQVGIIAVYTSNATTTGVNTDTPFKWGTTGTTIVQRIILSNETGADVRYELDAAATANSLRLKDGVVLFLAQPTAVVHFFTAASQTINQAGGIMIRGYN